MTTIGNNSDNAVSNADNDDNNESSISEEFITFVIENSDSDYSAFLSNYKSIKINVSDISKLTYNNIIAQYNN